MKISVLQNEVVLLYRVRMKWFYFAGLSTASLKSRPATNKCYFRCSSQMLVLLLACYFFLFFTLIHVIF